MFVAGLYGLVMWWMCGSYGVFGPLPARVFVLEARFDIIWRAGLRVSRPSSACLTFAQIPVRRSITTRNLLR